MLIVWKGASEKINLSGSEIAGCVLGVAGGVALLISIFFLPYLWRKVIHGDWPLRWYNIPQGPLLLKRGEVPPRPEGVQDIKDFYAGHRTKEEIEAERMRAQQTDPDDIEKAPYVSDADSPVTSPAIKAKQASSPKEAELLEEPKRKRPEGPVHSPAVLFYFAKRAFFHGVEQDVVSAQKKQDFLSGNVDEREAHAAHYDNRAEYMYSFLQVMTAATASFTHGANDVSK